MIDEHLDNGRLGCPYHGERSILDDSIPGRRNIYRIVGLAGLILGPLMIPVNAQEALFGFAVRTGLWAML